MPSLIQLIRLAELSKSHQVTRTGIPPLPGSTTLPPAENQDHPYGKAVAPTIPIGAVGSPAARPRSPGPGSS